MNSKHTALTLRTIFLWLLLPLTSFAADSSELVITNFDSAGSQKNLQFPLYPAAQSYTILSATNTGSAFAQNSNFFIAPYAVGYTTNQTNSAIIYTNFAYEWRITNAYAPGEFYRVAVTPMSSNALLAADVLNRLAYGPTPDELERVTAIGPQAYIDEQIHPWNLTENVANTHTNIAVIQAKLPEVTNFVTAANATISDLRAWHTLRAVGANRQLLEILLQFLENHFVTQYTKSESYIDNFYPDSTTSKPVAVQFEYLENEHWRDALLNPQCTFYDLLKISAESPAMIIYLDTVTSKGNGRNIANENYARELMELFTTGVDNGYDQNDITIMSRCWTGWRVEMVDFTNVANPLAPVCTTLLDTNSASTAYTNLYGAWVFNYKSQYHNVSNKVIFPGKIVPARFGPPWTTKTYGTNTIPGLYELSIPANLTGTNGIQEGYDVIQHIASLPFTAEYISVKLCRLFVHDDFPNPVNVTNNPGYGFYNYAGGNLSPEAELVHQCMLTWENSNPKGQIWPVLQTIFDSDLFRTSASSMQKVKTPLEYVVSAVRALRSGTNGDYTASTDGYSFETPLSRMGSMLLFDRDSPDGYPETGGGWISAGTLAERTRFVQSFCIAQGLSGHNGSQNGARNDAGDCICDPVSLLTNKLSAVNWTNADAVADYFVNILYPAEGAGNLAFYKQAAIDFLNDGSADSLNTYRNNNFSELPVSNSNTSAYDERVRGMVGMLLTFQRFQEQ
jgi:uncharacterized protein (DUF1800 family)